MSRAVHVASGTGDAQAVPAGGQTLVGFTVTSAAAGAVVYLRDGTTATDPVIASARVGAAGTVHVQVPAVNTSAGIFVDRDGTNAAELIIYLL